MMTRRFRLVAVSLGAFSLGAATAAAQTPTRTARAAAIAVSTVETNAVGQATRAAPSHSDAPVPLTAGQMRETVGAGWLEVLVEVVGGVVGSVVLGCALDIVAAACALNPSSCG